MAPDPSRREGVAKAAMRPSDGSAPACWWLAPLHDLVLSTVLASPKVSADDTTLPVLDPGRGRTKTGRLWCYAVHNCSPAFAGASRGAGRGIRPPPISAYLYSADGKAEHPAIHLNGFRGLLQVDGYAGFGHLVAGDARPQRTAT